MPLLSLLLCCHNISIAVSSVYSYRDNFMSYESAKPFRFLLARPSNAIYASIPTPTMSVCTVITSLYNTLHDKQNDRLQRHILHHPNNRSRNQWLSYQLAVLNHQSLTRKMTTHRLCTSKPSTRRSHRLPSIHNEASLARRECTLRCACRHQQSRVSSPRGSRGRSASAGAGAS